MHYKVKKNCSVRGATYSAGDVICEGDMPRSALLPLIAFGDIEQVGVIDKAPYVEPDPPEIPEPTPETPAVP